MRRPTEKQRLTEWVRATRELSTAAKAFREATRVRDLAQAQLIATQAGK